MEFKRQFIFVVGAQAGNPGAAAWVRPIGEPRHGFQEKPCLGFQEEPCLGFQEEPCLGFQDEPCRGLQEEPCLGSQEEPCLGSQEDHCLRSQEDHCLVSQQFTFCTRVNRAVSRCPKWIAMARHGLPIGANESYGIQEGF